MIKEIEKGLYKITANHGIEFTIKATTADRGELYISVYGEGGFLRSYFIDKNQLEKTLKTYEKAKRFFTISRRLEEV